MDSQRTESDKRVLLLAPTSRDSEATRDLLASAGIPCDVCSSLDVLCLHAALGAAAVIVPEEVVLSDESDSLDNALRRQPVWSDLPVIVLSRAGVESPAVERAMTTLGNVSVVERPMRVTTFLSVVRAALRARERQYQVRDQIEAMQRAEERLARDAMLLANVRDSVIVTDLNGVVTFWNEGATRLFGWTADEMLNRPYADRLPEPSRTEVAKWIGNIASGGGEFEGEWLDVRKDGSTVWIEATTRLIYDGQGVPLAIMGVSREITERKRADQEREQFLESERTARAEAERASRMKDEFLATLSHELRTPLNAILGWSQILAGGSKDAEDLAEGLRTIERNARAQTQIIEDLLDMSRIISGKVRLDVQQLDLAAVVREAMATAKPAADAKGIRVEAVIDASAGTMSGDPNRLQQVFWNLLTNAIKFTPKGGQVQVRLKRVNAHVEVSVIDNGEGISPEFLNHVFDRFRQADASSTRQHGGLGLGLSIVKQLMELHGGEVRATSPGIGMGATFTVTLPLTVIHPEPHVDERERRDPTARVVSAMPDDACGSLNGVKVLVVDDEADARTLMTRLLQDCRAHVVTAESASEALHRVRTERPDVLVCDIGMPGEDGYSLIKRVRALAPENGGRVPAAALTAYARSEDRVKAMFAGFQMHLAKPVEPAELIASVASLAGRIR
jgi:PAS domain S-box-containing protein